MEGRLAFHCRNKATGIMPCLFEGFLRAYSFDVTKLLLLAVMPCKRLDDPSWRNARKVCIGATAFA